MSVIDVYAFGITHSSRMTPPDQFHVVDMKPRPSPLAICPSACLEQRVRYVTFGYPAACAIALNGERRSRALGEITSSAEDRS